MHYRTASLQLLVAYWASSHYLNQWQLFVNQIPRNKSQSNSKQNTTIFIEGNPLQILFSLHLLHLVNEISKNEMHEISFRWHSARLQYLQCISNGNTAVLHKAIDLYYPWSSFVTRSTSLGSSGFNGLNNLARKGLHETIPLNDKCTLNIEIGISQAVSTMQNIPQ